MSTIQEQIDNLYTLTQESKDLVATINRLAPLAEEAIKSEIAIGKSAIVNALKELGVDCSVSDSLSILADKMDDIIPLIDNTIVVAASAPRPLEAGDLYLNGNYIKEVHDDKIGRFSYTTEYSALQVVNCPNVSTFSVRYQSSLYKANVLAATNCGNAFAYQSVGSLIDLTIGKNFTTNQNFNTVQYNPTSAYSKSSTSLCFDSDLNEYGRTFSTNNEKWNYCLREHFAANLQDRTGMDTLTITFGSTVLGQMEEETIAAFTNKNWTLA